MHCIGASSEYQLRLISEDVGFFYPVILELARHSCSPATEKGMGQLLGDRQTFVISSHNLPILDLTTVMDFDDGSGIILLGSCLGEISVIQFVDKSSQIPGSLLNSLPPADYDLPNMEMSLVPMILPHCYHCPDEIYEGNVPAAVRYEAITTWDCRHDFPKVRPPPGWSSDWSSHSCLQNWVLPFPRWRTLAADQQFHYDETWNRVLHSRLGHGDIIPIMYKEEDDDFVIFRIANRIYYFLRGPLVDEAGHFIRALPYSVQELSDPEALMHLWDNKWVRGPLYSRGRDTAAMMLLCRNQVYLWLLDYLKTDAARRELLNRSLSDDLRAWPLDDRREMLWKAEQLWDATHKQMNPPAED